MGQSRHNIMGNKYGERLFLRPVLKSIGLIDVHIHCMFPLHLLERTRGEIL